MRSAVLCAQYGLAAPRSWAAFVLTTRKPCSTISLPSAPARSCWSSLDLLRHSLTRVAAGNGGFSANDAVQNLEAIMAQMRADPHLSKILDKPRVQSALQAMKQDPGSISRYAGDPEIMAVLRRLLNYGVDSSSQQQFEEFGLTAGDAVQQMYSNPELAALLQKPRVRAALAEMRESPLRAMIKYEADGEVVRALELLEAALGPGGSTDVQLEQLRP